MVDLRIKRCFRLTGVLSLVLVGLGTGLFSLPGDVEAQTHSNLKSIIKIQGQKTRGVVRSENKKNIREYTQQHDMITQAITDAQTAIQSDLNNLLDNLPGAQGPCDVTPVWGKKFPGSERFVAVMDGAAYCDRETGVVWEAAPGADVTDWALAPQTCIRKEVGGRLGWRVPDIHELASLLDRSIAFPGPLLPAGHPFTNINSSQFGPQFGEYWSATAGADDPVPAWYVDFVNGLVVLSSKAAQMQVWCVRGGSPGPDAY